MLLINHTVLYVASEFVLETGFWQGDQRPQLGESRTDRIHQGSPPFQETGKPHAWNNGVCHLPLRTWLRNAAAAAAAARSGFFGFDEME